MPGTIQWRSSAYWFVPSLVLYAAVGFLPSAGFFACKQLLFFIHSCWFVPRTGLRWFHRGSVAAYYPYASVP